MQFNRAEPAIEKYTVRRLSLRQGEIARDGARASESVDRFLHGFGDAGILIAP